MTRYHSLPETGVQGMTTPESRLSGVELLQSREFDSVLDLGCAEGLITKFVVEQGAQVAHGFDGNAERVATANDYNADFMNQKCRDWGFYQGDFSDLAAFYAQFQDIMLPKYDVVLALGIFHKVSRDQVQPIVNNLSARCEKYILYRGGMAKHPNMLKAFQERGFHLEKKLKFHGKATTEFAPKPKNVAPLYFFSRTPYYERSKIGEYLARYGL